MATNIFVNLPVKDLSKSMDFFTSLGYTFNLQFTDDNAACLVISDTIFAMLLTEGFFKSSVPGGISDAKKENEVIIGLNADSKEAVEEIVQKAVAAGATTPKPATDHGFMYEYGFQDLDGHLWSYFYMDPSVVNG
jgi:predicted lactoylglutathione lyase